jgi:OOP family OmpA-OmpF porin
MRYLLLLFIVVQIGLSENLQDSDGDLIPDHLDLCPKTLEGVFVDKYGCQKAIEKLLYFETAQSIISLDQYSVIEEVVNLAKEMKGYKIFIQGHADSTSSSQVNQYISKQRALNVYNALSKELDKSRMVVSWYGESQPIASNVTKEGRSLNRRVTIHLR